MKKIFTLLSLLLMLAITSANAATFNVTLKVSGDGGEKAYEKIAVYNLTGHPTSDPTSDASTPPR
ncbi:MAG: hypothetical protein J1E57_10220 [Prevotella sp.]|nr:hypothetical protein [Prevotella sp.]